jgi:tetratricopeptide (TPR) repeat protein
MRKILLPLAVSVTALAFVITGAYAVIDISARGRILSVRGINVESVRTSSTLSKSLAHYTMGIICDNEGNFKEAISEYRQAISLEPNISYVHTRLAVDYILTEDTKAALDELNIARSLDPGDVKPKLAEAMEELERAVKLEPKDPDIKGHLEAVRKKIRK